MSAVRCFYLNCKTVNVFGSFYSFFKFPDDNRRGLWIFHCGGYKFQNEIRNVKNVYICERHFRLEDVKVHGSRKTLSKSALPLPISNDFCSCSVYSVDPMCKSNLLACEELTINTVKKDKIKPQQIVDYFSSVSMNITEMDSPPSPPLILNRQENVKTYIRNYSIPDIPEESVASPSQFPEPFETRKSFEESLKENNPSLYKVKKNIFQDNKRRKNIKIKENVQSYIKQILKGKKPNVKTFINTQMFHKVGQKWSKEEKQLFTKLHFTSPACFREMQNMGFSMPSVSSILRWHSKIPFRPGINQSILDLLKNKAHAMNPLEKKCVLLLDEMAIKNEIEYNSTEDIMYGFRDLGKGKRSQNIGSSALLIMLRGLNANWKQTVAYYVGKVSAEDLKEILLHIVEEISITGLEILSITCDQGSTNRSLFKKIGATFDNPFLIINKRKIICLFDPPHLIKSIRNCLLKADIQVGEKRISWDILRKLYNEEKNNTIRACFRLTDRHIYPDSFDKLSVKLATQVFSLNVSASIELGVSLKIFKSDEVEIASYTAESFRKINDLFDNLNSVAKFSCNPQRNAISHLNAEKVLNNLKESKIWIKEWKHLGHMERPYCFDGMLQTINGILLLWENIKLSQDYLITSHINQDPLENCISMLRRNKGSYERNPSALRLARNIRQIVFQNFVPSDTTGYAVSDSQVLLEEPNTSFVITDEQGASFDRTHDDFDNFVDNIIPPDIDISEELIRDERDEEMREDVEEELLIYLPSLENHAIVYLAGYIAKKLSNRFNCSVCTVGVLASDEKNINNDTLIILRAYPTTKTNSEYGMLTLPSELLVKYLTIVVKYFEENIAKIQHEENLLRLTKIFCWK